MPRLIPTTLAAAALSLCVASIVLAQPPGGRGGRGGFGGPGGPFGGGGVVNLIQTDEVQREIELSDDQQESLRALRDEVQDQVRNEMGDMFRGMRDLSDEERQARFDEIRTRFEAINKEAETRLQQTLLPHQYDRLKQIDVQARIQRGGASALSDGELAETLGLTDSQRDELREKSEQVEKDLNDKIQQLRIDARKQLLDVLTPEQRAKLEGMMGAEFAVPEPQFGPQRGGRFGFGGRGGRNRDRGNQDAPPAAE